MMMPSSFRLGYIPRANFAPHRDDSWVRGLFWNGMLNHNTAVEKQVDWPKFRSVEATITKIGHTTGNLYQLKHQLRAHHNLSIQAQPNRKPNEYSTQGLGIRSCLSPVALARAESASEVFPRTCKARYLLVQASTESGSSLIATSKHFMASSYSPLAKRALPFASQYIAES